MNGMADVRAPEAALAIPRLEDGFVNMQEPLRQLAESVVNEMMSAEAYQPCQATGNSRNGYRERGLVTCVGTLTLRIPKLRAGSFFPDDATGRYQRVDRAIVAAVSETCATGTSTRKVQGGGRRDGLRRVMEEVFQGATWQRCVVHLMRDCARAASGSRSPRRRVSRIVAPVFRLRDAGAAGAAYHPAIEMLESCRGDAAGTLEEAEPDAPACLDFPASHWKRLRTNNVQERANREARRGSRVVQVFPSVASPERLAGAAMCDMDEEWAGSRYFSKRKMDEPCNESRAAGTEEPPTPERLSEWRPVAKRAIDASLEPADEMEAA